GIQEAISRENVSITAFLIKSGAETLKPEYIQEAVKKENLELSKLLVEQGAANVNDAIVEATKTANVEITEYLLEKGATPVEALKEAMETNNEDIIMLLLEKTTTIAPDFISTAARKGNAKIIEELIRRGSNPQEGFEDALRYKQTDAFVLLLEKGAVANQESLRIAVSYGFVDGVRILIAQGMDSNVAFSSGEYPMHMVATSFEDHDMAMIAELVKDGAEINVKNRNGETPLHLAIQGGQDNRPLIDTLIELGANPKAKTKNGNSPIDYASDKEFKSYLKKAFKRKKS
ncbi:MAG: ankyrin repeat protein, partial [Flavobacteriales bacterium]